MSNIDKMTANEQLFTELTPEEGAVVAGGMFQITLEKVGPIQFDFLLLQEGLEPNPTAIQICSEADLPLNYGLAFDNLTFNTINPEESQEFFGNGQVGVAFWDENLAQPGIQGKSLALEPGCKYVFKRV